MFWAPADANGASAARTMPIGTTRHFQLRWWRDPGLPDPVGASSACPLPEAVAPLAKEEAGPLAPTIIVSKR